MRNITTTIVGTLAVGLALGAAAPAQAGPNGMRCVVSSPISATQVNEPNNATWSFEVFDAKPNLVYNVQVTYAADPSNGGHPNTGIETDANGYGITTLPRWWVADGSLPGHFESWDPSDPISGFVADPGDFEVRIGPKAYVLPDYTTIVRAGKTTCGGTITE